MRPHEGVLSWSIKLFYRAVLCGNIMIYNSPAAHGGQLLPMGWTYWPKYMIIMIMTCTCGHSRIYRPEWSPTLRSSVFSAKCGILKVPTHLSSLRLMRAISAAWRSPLLTGNPDTTYQWRIFYWQILF